MSMARGDNEAALARHRGGYGVDAPYVPAAPGLVGLIRVAVGAIFRHRGARCPAVAAVGSGLLFLISASWYLAATRRGEFAVWAEILTALDLRGDERLLDLGCGRGAVLLMAAKLLPDGRAIGVDLWRAVDQSGNARAVTVRNAALEGVADRVELVTADMQTLSFPEATFDVVLSSLAIHDLPEAADRARAIDEAARVLRPGGAMCIVDFHGTDAYARNLRDLGLIEVTNVPLGWGSWYGGPWAALKLVAARKPVGG
jgi:SAM-dependent methyltransferase